MGDPVLHAPADAVDTITDEIRQLVADMFWGILGGIIDNIIAQHDRFADGLWRVLWARWGIFKLGCGRGLNTWQQLGHRALPHWRAVVEEG